MAEWTTEDVRFLVVRSARASTPVAFQAHAMLDAEEKFNAWLTAHDAEVRAKVLEPVRQVFADLDAQEDAAGEWFCGVDKRRHEVRVRALDRIEAIANGEPLPVDRARAERGVAS